MNDIYKESKGLVMQFSSAQVKVTGLFLEIACRHVLTYDIYWLLLFWKSNYFEDGLHTFSLTFFSMLTLP